MTNNLTLSFEDKDLRIIDRDGQPWFVLTDVCRAIGIKNPAQVAQRLDDDERYMFNIDPLGAGRAIIVSEPGLYKTILRSDAAVTKGSFAHRYLRWVTHEVLPSIRAHGFYDPARLAEVEALQLSGQEELDGINREPKERLYEEIARYEAESGLSFETAIKSLISDRQWQTVKKMEGNVHGLLHSPAMVLANIGFDIRYIYSGHRELTEDERRLRAMFRASPPERRLELIRRAHTLALPEE